MLITVDKLGTGTIDDPYRPNTTETSWVVISESETQFTIEIPAI